MIDDISSSLKRLRRGLVRCYAFLTQKPERFFLLVALLAGLYVVVVLPPYRGLDEASHIFRITQLTGGDLFMEKVPGGYGHPIADYVNNVNVNEFSQAHKNSFFSSFSRRYTSGQYPANRVVTSQAQLFEGSGAYSPLVYAHFAPVGVFAKLTHLNGYIYTLLLRLSNLLLFVACAYFAIKIIPFGKWLLVAVALLPMSLHQAATVSGDVILMSSVLLFVALVAYLMNIKKQPRNQTTVRNALIGTFASGLLIGGSKPGYILLVLAAFIIPVTLFKSIKQKLLFCSSLFMASAVLLVIWSTALSFAHLGSAVETFRARVNGGGTTISTGTLIKQTVITPWKTAGLFSNTFLFEANNPLPFPLPKDYNAVPDFILSNFTGLFGSLNVPLPQWASFMVILNLFVVVFGYARGIVLSQKSKLLIAAIIVVQFLGVFLVFWKTWTSTTMTHVWGLQGRYYIPLVPLLLFLAPKRSIFIWKEDFSQRLTIIFTCLPLLVMAVLISQTFYL